MPGYDGLVIDAVSEQPEPNARDDLGVRRQVYQANHIPAVIMQGADLSEPGWPNNLYHQITQAYRQPMNRYGLYIVDR